MLFLALNRKFVIVLRSLGATPSSSTLLLFIVVEKEEMVGFFTEDASAYTAASPSSALSALASWGFFSSASDNDVDISAAASMWLALVGVFIGGATAAAFLLAWKLSSVLREPKWVRNAPVVPANSIFGLVMGTIIEYVKKGKFCRTFMQADQPDILRLHNGICGGIFRDMIIVKDPKVAKQILLEKTTKKPERGYRAFRRLTGYVGSPDFLSSRSHRDALYKRTRTVAYEAFMKRMYTRYDTDFLDTVFKFTERVGSKKDGRFSVVHEMHLIATSLITRIAFNEDSENMDYALFQSAVWIINDMVKRPQNCSLSFLDWIPTPTNFELWRRQKLLTDTIRTMINHKKKKPGDDVISVLLRDKQNTDNDLLGILSIFFFRGIRYDLKHNEHGALPPRSQPRRAAESETGRVSYHRRRKFGPDSQALPYVYLLAVIKETLRMFPAVPLFAREVTQTHDSGVCPRFKEASTFGASINVFGLHYNPKAWNKPKEFIPERWLDPSIDADRSEDDRLYCPFSIGKRACLGRQFAYVEMLTVISSLLQRYHISPTDDGASTVNMFEGGTLCVEEGLELVLTPYHNDVPQLITSPPISNEPVYTSEEVMKHHSSDDLWMIVDGGVYDLTNFAQGERGGHPGGAEILVTYAGADGTAEFDFINHSKFAHRLLSRYRIGKLSSDCAAKALRKEDSSRHVLGKKHALKKRRVTVSVIQDGLHSPPPLRYYKS